ncbi:MAG: NfeD family protein [Bacteroidales bacterium]|nr:NfeD family protein [Bacteroidales bacterium]
MIAWWNSLSTVMQVLWAITLSASLIFVIQTVLTFLGIGGDGGIDADVDMGGDVDFGGGDGTFDADPSMNLLTFRNFVNFCLGFGWTAVLMRDKVKSDFLLMLVAVIVGIGLVAAVMWLFKWLSGMQQSGNIDVHSAAVGCEGKVYLTIPGERAGEGKVQITINNSVREYDALCEGDTIPTGAPIKVVGVVNDHTLIVEEITPTII